MERQTCKRRCKISPHWKLHISYFRREFRQIHKCHGFYSFCAPVRYLIFLRCTWTCLRGWMVLCFL